MIDKIVVHPGYFGSIAQFAAMVRAESVIFENEDHYQKQTYRTRQYIFGANGKLLLNIPIIHRKTGKGHQKYRDVEIENSFHWQHDHWKSLQTAYQTSPYFEFYEDDFAPLYKTKYTRLLDFNYDCLKVLEDVLEVSFGREKTTEYHKEIAEDIIDARTLIIAKKGPSQNITRYPQVFEYKFGFLNNLSVLDLIFNEGPNAGDYLSQQHFNLV